MILSATETRDDILKKSLELYEAVRTTAGPKGGDYLFETPYGLATTHDGATVARVVAELQGGNLISGAASAVERKVGDGTTAVISVTHHLIDQAYSLIAAKHNPIVLRDSIYTASTKALDQLDTMATPATDLVAAATISSRDPKLGEIIGTIVKVTGADGSVIVEETDSLADSYEIVEGYSFARGYTSPLMANERKNAVYTSTPILITDESITSIQDLLPLLEKIGNKHNKLVVICGEVDEVALRQITTFSQKNPFSLLVIKAPFLAQERTHYLSDIAAMTGAVFVSGEMGYSITRLDPSMLGSADKVVSTKDATTIIGGGGDPEAITSRIIELRDDNEMARAAALDLKVAVIRVGGITVEEMSEKKYRVDDAVAATKAALSGGIVPGGEVTLVRLAQSLSDETIGERILKVALVQPFRDIITNAGLNADEKLPLIISAKDGYGFDLNAPDKLVDMKKAGIVDPMWVLREVILNAVSIAGTAIKIGGSAYRDKE